MQRLRDLTAELQRLAIGFRGQDVFRESGCLTLLGISEAEFPGRSRRAEVLRITLDSGWMPAACRMDRQ